MAAYKKYKYIDLAKTYISCIFQHGAKNLIATTCRSNSL